MLCVCVCVCVVCVCVCLQVVGGKCFVLSDSCCRTKKYMMGLALGLPCVAYGWVRECIEKVFTLCIYVHVHVHVYYTLYTSMHVFLLVA